jgi:hypothetical protein
MSPIVHVSAIPHTAATLDQSTAGQTWWFFSISGWTGRVCNSLLFVISGHPARAKKWLVMAEFAGS